MSTGPPTRVLINDRVPQALGGGYLVIPQSSVVAMDRQDVPAERDDKLIFLATESGPAERATVPPTTILTFELGFLAIEITPEEAVNVGVVIFSGAVMENAARIGPPGELAPGPAWGVRGRPGPRIRAPRGRRRPRPGRPPGAGPAWPFREAPPAPDGR